MMPDNSMDAAGFFATSSIRNNRKTHETQRKCKYIGDFILRLSVFAVNNSRQIPECLIYLNVYAT